MKQSSKNNDFFEIKEKDLKIKDSSKKTTIVLTLISVFTILSLFITNSYAIFTSINHSSNYNYIKAGTLNIAYDDESLGLGGKISLENALPITDEEAKNLEMYKFKLTNTGDIIADYKISLINDSDLENIEKSALRFSIISDRGEEVLANLDEGMYENYLIQGALLPKESIVYEFKLWINEDAKDEDYVNKNFNAKIVLNSSQITSNVDRLTNAKCFTFSSNTIIDYNKDCGSVVTIPASYVNDQEEIVKIESIGTSAFKNKNLNAINFQYAVNLKTIDDQAFESNDIKTVLLPSSLTKVGKGLFIDNPEFYMVVNGPKLDIDWKNAILGVASNKVKYGYYEKENLAIVVPVENKCFNLVEFDNSNMEIVSYNDSCGSYVYFSNIIDGKYVSIINSEAFKNKNLRAVYLQNGYLDINKAFSNKSLNSIRLSDTITTLKDDALSFNNLKYIELPKSLSFIGENSLSNNYLDSLEIPVSVTTIKNKAIYKTDTSNPNLIKIINKTNKAFDWGIILSDKSLKVISGVIETPYGNVEISVN